MELRDGYKQTELGIIPNEWMVLTIGSLGLFSKGRGIKKDEASSGNIPCVRYGEIYTYHNDIIRTFNSQISSEVAKTSKRLKLGDILFAGSGETKEEIGKSIAFVSEVEAYAGGDIVILSTHNTDPIFLGYLLNAPYVSQQKASKGQGDAVVHISAKSLSSITISVPSSKNEQRAIATALSDVDALLDSLDKLITKKRDIKQAAMQELLTGKKRLPGFDGEWEKFLLGDFVQFIKNGVNSRAELTQTDSIKYLHYGDIHASSSVLISPLGLPGLPSDKAKNLDRLKNGDLILADASEDTDGIGKSVEIKDVGETEFVAGLHTIAARFDEIILADGFKAYLQFIPEFITKLRRLAAGTKVYAITRSHISSIEMRLPNTEEQFAIAKVLSDMDTEIHTLEKRRAKTRDLKQAMMQELLTGRTRLI